jgi:hypothetical protein
MSNLKKTQQQAWQYYRGWMIRGEYCMALKQPIRISRKGWDHIFKGTNSKKRNLRDKRRRLLLLKSAGYIIRSASSFQVTKRGSESYFVLDGKANGESVRVILKRDKDGRYYLYSVM